MCVGLVPPSSHHSEGLGDELVREGLLVLVTQMAFALEIWLRVQHHLRRTETAKEERVKPSVTFTVDIVQVKRYRVTAEGYTIAQDVSPLF